ncbi:MAG: hypothetical protein AB8G14_13805 [Ilumatobacter sp.]
MPRKHTVGKADSETAPDVFVIVDVEPDAVVGGDDADLAGPHRAFEMLETMRRELANERGLTINYSWMMRADRHVHETYGTSTHLLERFADTLEECRSKGDLVGAHVHAFADSHDHEDWRDPQSLAIDAEVSCNSFEEVLGRPPEAIGFARGFTSIPAVEVSRRRGVRFDFSVVPGISAPTSSDTLKVIAAPFDNNTVPLTPYRPSADDWRTPDPNMTTGPTIVPLTPARINEWQSRRARLRVRGEQAALDRRTHHVYLMNIDQPGFARVFKSRAVLDSGYLTMSVRSSRFLMTSDAQLRGIADRLSSIGGTSANLTTAAHSARTTLQPA